MATKNVKNQSVNSKVSALKSIREANKETKSLSGVIKTIRSFWKEGYKDAFEGYLGLSFKDIELLWAESYWNEERTKMLYPAKVAKKNDKGEYILKDGKKVYEKVMKEYNQNFTVMRVFDALLQGKIERGELKL